VELLVVIGIIGGLLALIVPTVQGAIRASRQAAIKTEIEMLHMAIQNYKNEYGSYPPCVDVTVATTGAGAGVRHLRRLFARCPNPQVQLRNALTVNGTTINLTPNNALSVWLSGFTGDSVNPLDPLSNRKRLYDFDQIRVSQANGQYKAPYSQSTPYVYFDSSRYADIDGQTINDAGVTVSFTVWRNSQNPKNPAALPLHPDTFQIISAGLDGEFFTDDDLSNMWPGTWGEYKTNLP
jgi:type II secretory pathway pseudopilin PulG